GSHYRKGQHSRAAHGRVLATRPRTCARHRSTGCWFYPQEMLTVLGGMAGFERELIRARTGEGRKRAKERGVRFGRPPKLNAHQRREALARREKGETLMDIARSYGVSHLTIMRLAASSPFEQSAVAA